MGQAQTPNFQLFGVTSHFLNQWVNKDFKISLVVLANKDNHTLEYKDAYTSLYSKVFLTFRGSGFRGCGPLPVWFATFRDSGVLPFLRLRANNFHKMEKIRQSKGTS